jgi:hypothetical protein
VDERALVGVWWRRRFSSGALPLLIAFLNDDGQPNSMVGSAHREDNAEFLYKSQIPTEQRRLLDTVLSNCTFDRGSLYPTYASPFDLLVKGNEQEIGGPSGTSFATGYCGQTALCPVAERLRALGMVRSVDHRAVATLSGPRRVASIRPYVAVTTVVILGLVAMGVLAVERGHNNPS